MDCSGLKVGSGCGDGVFRVERRDMEAFLRKYMWAINFGLIGVGALLLALLVNGVLAIQLAKWTVPQLPNYEQEGRLDDDRGGNDRVGWVDGLQRRCLFGCPEEVDPNVCPEGCPEGEFCDAGTCVPENEAIAEESGNEVPVATELNMVLDGVMVAQNSRWSMAMIRDQSQNKTHVAGVGDMISLEPPIEVLEIRRDRVFIDHDGRLEFIRIEGAFDGDPSATRATSSGRTSEAPARTDTSARERQEAQRAATARTMVREEDDNSFVIDREAVRTQLQDPAALTRQARIMPNYRDGEPNGLRLVGVTPNSFYSEIGIRSGDVIHSINGTKITNQRQALELMERMSSEDQVTIEVERRGRTQTMEYKIE